MDILIRLPRIFFDDRKSRDLPVGEEWRRVGNEVVTHITPADLADYKKDAEHYATALDAKDGCPADVIRSAKTTIKAIARQKH